MTSWNIIGWILLIVGGTWMLGLAIRLAWIFIEHGLGQRKIRRANAGKLRCEDPEPCYAIATRQTPNGYFCDAHWPDHRSKGTRYRSVSFARPLDWTQS